jgi:glutamate dehydrogenase/leucine dehydrogenase
MAITGIEALGWTHEEAESQVVAKVRDGLRRLLDLSQQENITTEAAARRLAEERLAKAVRGAEG